MLLASVTGAGAGGAMGYVLMRSQLCFHSMFAETTRPPRTLLRGWILAVAIASVGLSILYDTPASKGLNTGLAFVPVADIVGGATIGVGMVIASSCVSGLFYKLGSGMLGAAVGIAGWIAGEAAARRIHLPGPTVRRGGPSATFAALLHLPRLALSIALLAVVVAALWRIPARRNPSQPPWQWGWQRTGTALGAVTIAGWILARVGHSPFGPSTVGATVSVIDGHPNWWLIGFLAGITGGAVIAATTAGGSNLRGEEPVRYLRLLAGGFLLGAGGWIAGGCNLGHGLSGVAQLNISSWVVVATMALTVATFRALASRVPSRRVLAS